MCCINRSGTGAVVDCRVSVGLVLWQYWTVEYQKGWSGTRAGADCRVLVGLVLAVVDCVISTGLVLGQ